MMALKVADRGNLPPFIVMDVMKSSAEREATGADVLHLEVGQPSTPAPRSFTTTLAPCLARPRACSRPTPRAAPVTSATLPSHKRAIYYLQKYIFSFIFRLDLEKQVEEHHPLNNR